MTTRNRSELKSYFVKGAIPTEGNFADLIDSQLNQTQDGVFKPDGEALSVVAATGAQKRALRLYASYPATSPDWMISLNPAQDPANAATTSRLGLGVTDGVGKTRLFIDAATGYLGVGTNAPQVALDVAGAAQANGFRGRYDLLLDDYRTLNPSSNVCLQAPANDRDAWIYRDATDASSNSGIYHRQIDTAVGNLPGNSIGFVGGSGSQLQAYVNLSDGSGFFAGPLLIGKTKTTTSGTGRVRVGVVGSTPGLYSEDSQDIVIGCAAGQKVHLGQLDKVTVQDGILTASGDIKAGGSWLTVKGVGSEQGYIGGDGNGTDVQIGSMKSTIMTLGVWNTAAGDYMSVAARNFSSQSDERAKEHIEPIQGALEKVARLRGVSFDWKSDQGQQGMPKQLGLVAQQVREVAPEAVMEGKGGLLSITYNAITALLVEAVKEQQQHIDEQQQHIDALRAARTPASAH